MARGDILPRRESTRTKLGNRHVESTEHAGGKKEQGQEKRKNQKGKKEDHRLG